MTARVPFTAGTFNLGNAGVNEIAKVVDECDVIGLQEASDRREDIQHVCSRLGYRALTFADMPGGPATPLLYDPRTLLWTRPLFVPLLRGGTFVGPGTGPDHAKAKNLQGGYFIHKATRRRVAVGNLHLLAGQKGRTHGTANRRRLISRAMVSKSVDEMHDFGGLPIYLGDMNSDADTWGLHPFRFYGWTNSHEEGARVPTHGKRWAPDQVWWREERRNGERDDRLKFRGHHVVKTRSDHDALIVEFGLKERGTR